MREVAYLFERFPSFGQTFCYREVAELERQGTKVHVYSIRRPLTEPKQDWDEQLVRRVHYLPEENALVREVDRSLREGRVSDAAREAVKKWGRQSDFLRLYQAVYVGLRLQQNGVRHLHAHFAGMAARTAFGSSSFLEFRTASPRMRTTFLRRVISSFHSRNCWPTRVIVTVSDYAADFLKNRFPAAAAKVHRIYNGVDLARFIRLTLGANPGDHLRWPD